MPVVIKSKGFRRMVGLAKKAADHNFGLSLRDQLFVLRHGPAVDGLGDRKSTRLNSSHVAISYAVFCLKKKTNALSRYQARYIRSKLRRKNREMIYRYTANRIVTQE